MNINKELVFWSSNLNISLTQFGKPYIKESNQSDITHRGIGHGTCTVAINSISIKEDIMMSIKAISDNYASKV